MCSVESWHFRWPWVTFEGHFGAADARSVCDCCVSCYLNVLTESCGWPASQQVRRTQDVSLLAVHMRRWIRLSRTAGMYSFPFPITFKLISINKADFYRTGPDRTYHAHRFIFSFTFYFFVFVLLPVSFLLHVKTHYRMCTLFSTGEKFLSSCGGTSVKAKYFHPQQPMGCVSNWARNCCWGSCTFLFLPVSAASSATVYGGVNYVLLFLCQTTQCLHYVLSAHCCVWLCL